MFWKNIKITKSLKAPFVVYLDLECLLKKGQSRENNNNKKNNNNNNSNNNNKNKYVKLVKDNFGKR